MSNTKGPEINVTHLPVLEFGASSIEHLPFETLNVFTQTRQQYDEDALQDLVRSIELPDKDGNPRNLLLHPLFVNILDEPEAEAYIKDLNLCHKTNHSLNEAIAMEDGRYAIVVAGHRRRLAIGRAIEHQGGSAASLVEANVVYNQSFDDALTIQMNENVHAALWPYEDARAIQAKYAFGVARGEYTSVADCIRALPYGAEKVRNALRYCELPAFIQDSVENGFLSYSAAVALHPAMKGMEIRYADDPNQQQIVDDSLTRWTLRIIKHGWGKDIVASQVAEMLASWEKEKAFEFKLFDIDEAKVARQQRQQAYRELFTEGMGLMRAFVGIAANAELFTSLPTHEQEAILQEVKEFHATLGSLAISDSQAQSFFD